jgi:hypothetical protein
MTKTEKTPAGTKPVKEFKEILYEALLVAFGKILAKYNVFAQGSILKDVGREIIVYLDEHGYNFKETGKMEDMETLTNLFVKNGFADKLDVEPVKNGTRYTWHNLYGIDAYKELFDLVDNPFLSCPLNLCLYYMADKHHKTMQLYKKTFDMKKRTSVTDYAVVEQDESVTGDAKGKDFDPLVIENARLYQLARERADRLEKAQKEIKALRGILPICASCKKIRDDEGYWQQVELYIGEHSEALFTHSLCPDCLPKYFPEEGKYERQPKRQLKRKPGRKPDSKAIKKAKKQ